MATTLKTIGKTKTFDARIFFADVLSHISDSIGDMVVTVSVLGMSLYFIVQLLPAALASDFAGMYILAMLTQLFVRIVHRFDDHYTTDELAERMIEMEQALIERIDRMEANQ
jgi:divalent metal cation (Fe/Co/Zn/Cd) transporter